MNKYTTNGAYQPYVTGLFEDGASVMERYWLSTNGVAIIVDASVPLFLRKNSSDLCFLSSASLYPYVHTKAAASRGLTYDICIIDRTAASGGGGGFLNELHLHVIRNYFSAPSGLPDDLMLKYPIWSTWAKYKRAINSTSVLEFAQQIHDFSGSRVAHLEIDDMWETSYGNLDFDEKKFGNFAELIKRLEDTYGYTSV